MDIIIYGIIGALAILVCWLLDIYSPTMGNDSISMYSPKILPSGKVILPTCCFCQKARDSQDNWQERNAYQADNQVVISTQTFCPEKLFRQRA